MRGSIQRRGASWRAVIDQPRQSGERRRQRVASFSTRREAEAWLGRMLAAAPGHPGASLPRQYGGTLTLAHFLDRWLGAVTPTLKPSTVERYRQDASRWTPLLGQVPLRRLHPLQVQEAANILAQRLAPTTVRSGLLTLRTALRRAVTWDLVDADPTQGVRVRAPWREMACWDESQSAAFLQAVEGSTRYAALFRLALASGLRLGELLGLRWGDVDWGAGTLSVRRSLSWPPRGRPQLLEPKTRAGRRLVTLDAGTVARLDAHRRRQDAERAAAGAAWQGLDLVFCTRTGGFVHRREIERRFHACRRRAGLPSIRVHDLRHTHATLLLRHGRGVKEVAERLGHSSVTVTLGTYGHVLPDDRRRAAAVIGGLLDGPPAPSPHPAAGDANAT